MKIFKLLFCVVFFLSARVQAEEGFSASAEMTGEGTNAQLSVTLKVPAGYHLYADQVAISAAGKIKLVPRSVHEPVEWQDVFTGDKAKVYERDETFKYGFDGEVVYPVTVNVRWQGCSESTCFMPASTNISVMPGNTPAPLSAPSGAAVPQVSERSGDWREVAERFRETGRGTGFLNVPEFLAMLDSAETGGAGSGGGWVLNFEKNGFLWTILLIIAGGLALNLTPCVLPMIPVNIAIIGAGIQAMRGAEAGARLRWRGFVLGIVYGAGIAVAYGLLGFIVVFTGSRFGFLNSSPSFNFIMAVLFLVLALGMFGVVNIDFSRFMGRAGGGANSGNGRLGLAFSAGAISALLAGACVAPVVISVLVFSAKLYSEGRFAGLLLPFLLGLGMALPWPFAGAGLSFLPKPGKWMEYVKYGFGVIILVMAVYYAREAYGLLPDKTSQAEKSEISDEDGWGDSLSGALVKGLREEKPVFIDFRASWCKSCVVMDKTTFKNADVLKRLDRYVKVKYQAEKPDEAAVKAVLDYFGIIGLPSYVMLEPLAR